MQEEIISLETAKLAKEKGFTYFNKLNYIEKDNIVVDSFNSCYQVLLQKWLNNEFE